MTSSEELGRLKALPRTLRKPLSSLEQEAQALEGSLYHLWWRCLNVSTEYLECCEQEGKGHPLKETYALFGDVRGKWRPWWVKTGRKLFSERHDYLQVRAITKDRALSRLEVEPENFLILDIPLGLRRVTILEQVNKLLDEYHPGRELDVWAQSTAKVKLHKSNLQERTLPILVQVAELLHEEPEMRLYELADRARIAEIHLGRAKAEELTQREERQRREMAAKRYKEQALALVANAARGVFPCVD